MCVQGVFPSRGVPHRVRAQTDGARVEKGVCCALEELARALYTLLHVYVYIYSLRTTRARLRQKLMEKNVFHDICVSLSLSILT